MNLLKAVFIISAATFTLAGCADNKPSQGELMLGHAASTQEQADLQRTLASDWSRGQKLVKEGKEKVEDGSDLMKSAKEDYDDGEEQVNEGKNEIAKGTRLMQESDLRFREVFKDLPLEKQR